MTPTCYDFALALSVYTTIPTELVVDLLPTGIHPLEPKHGESILSFSVFDFLASEVGAYRELVFSVLVQPWVMPKIPFAKAALFPFQVATTTAAARVHAIERWHLPHFPEDIAIVLEADEKGVRAKASHLGLTIVDIDISSRNWATVHDRYQSFMIHHGQRFMADIAMVGEASEHEDGSGHVRLTPNPLLGGLSPEEVEETPFRETVMRNGRQTFLTFDPT